jgi:hypothetical protein
VLTRLTHLDLESPTVKDRAQEHAMYFQITEILLNISSHQNEIIGLRELPLDCIVFEAVTGQQDFTSSDAKVDLFILAVYNKLQIAGP